MNQIFSRTYKVLTILLLATFCLCISCKKAALPLALSVTANISKPNKYVGILYCIEHDHHNLEGCIGFPNDRCAIYPADVPYGGRRYWGEPEIGRYLSSDGEAINKHADQLSDAGIDFIGIDFSNSDINGPSRLSATLKLLDIYTNRIRAGIPTPKIVFFSPGTSGEHDGVNQLQKLYDLIYTKYEPQIFFMYGDKPLVLLSKDHTASEATLSHFEWRLMHAFGESDWSFMDLTPQIPNTRGSWPEQMAVSAAQQQNCMSCPSAHGRHWNYRTAGNNGEEGQNFADQWEVVAGTQPTFVFIKSWNEWIAIRREDTGRECGGCFTDEFNSEFSNDIEPMKNGHGDFYLRMMKEKIAKFKKNSPNFIIRNTGDGTWYFKYGRDGRESKQHAANNFTHTAVLAGGNFRQPIVGDFNDDNLLDVGLRDTRDGRWHLLINNGNGEYNDLFQPQFAPGVNYQPFVGDFDGDGKTDIGMRDRDTGIWFFWRKLSEGSYGDQKTKEGLEHGQNYEPYVGDFDGDGKTDIGMRDRDIGVWYFWYGDGRGGYDRQHSFPWENTNFPKYRPFVGDFDCDGFTDIGLYNTEDGRLHLANSNRAGYYHNFDTYLWEKRGDYQVFIDPRPCK